MQRTSCIVLTFVLGCGAASAPAETLPATESAEDSADLDGDHDGILDANDACPCAPEDIDAFEDEDGCPDPDNDGDCFQDACDACPMEAENFNGTEDEDGCPDRGRTLLIDTQIRILDHVYFRPRATVTESRQMPIVEAVAATLVGNPEVLEVAVIGRSTPQEGERVARARAQGVMDSLVTNGVESARLTLRIEVEGRGPEAHQVFFEILRADPPAPQTDSVPYVCTRLIPCEAMPVWPACQR